MREQAAEAARVKQANATADMGTITRELQRLNLIKLRHSDEVIAECDAYTAALAEKERIQNDKTTAKNALDAHSANMFASYQTTINNLLRKFGAGFRMSLGPSYIGREPTSSVQFLIDDLHPIDAGRSDTPLGTPSFRTAMSAGDKGTLALALFLAQLEHNPNKANSVLVFDDPFNSMDSARREHTAQLLVKWGRICDSMILLSHDPVFIGLVKSKLNAGEDRLLQLGRVQGGRATELTEWDSDPHMRSAYALHHNTLVSYQHSVETADVATLQNVAKSIRLLLESFIARNNPGQIPEGKWLGDMIGMIRAGNLAPGLVDRLEDLSSVNDYSKRYHHETDGPVPGAIPNDAELSSFVELALEIVG